MLAPLRDLDLNALRAFVRVVDRGGFAVAARELGVPTSTVSRMVGRLEAAAGARLLQRTSRSMRTTAEGRALYDSVGGALGTIERAALAVEPPSRVPRGLLRATAPVDLGGAFLADVAVAFAERYPHVQVDLALTNRPVSLVDEGFDVALRAAARLADSTLIAHKLGELEHALYASPRYLASRGAPATPAELDRHSCLVFRARELEKTWHLRGHDGPVEVHVRSRMGGDDFGYLRAAAIAGGGVALLPRLLCAKDEAAGRLVRVLPAYTAAGAGLYVLYPSASQVPARVTAFRDFVAAGYEAWRRTLA